VRIKPGHRTLKLPSQDLQEEVSAVRAGPFGTLSEVSLSDVADDRTNIFKRKDFSGRLLHSIDLPGQHELQPDPILHALVDIIQIPTTKLTAPDDLVTGHAVGIERVLRRDAGALRVFRTNPALQIGGQPTVVATCVARQVDGEVAVHALDRALVVADVLGCFLQEAGSEEVEEEHPAVIIAETLQLDVVRAQLLPQSLQTDVRAHLVDRRRHAAQIRLSWALSHRRLQLAVELLLQKRARAVDDSLS